MKFRKYEFLPEEWATLKQEIQVSYEFNGETITSWNPDLIESVVEIGHIMISPPEIDEEMNVTTEAVLSDKYSVDILWKTIGLESWRDYRIWCEPVGIHSFGASIDADYIAGYNNQKAK
jgi:hypothetical protein